MGYIPVFNYTPLQKYVPAESPVEVILIACPKELEGIIELVQGGLEQSLSRGTLTNLSQGGQHIK